MVRRHVLGRAADERHHGVADPDVAHGHLRRRPAIGAAGGGEAHAASARAVAMRAAAAWARAEGSGVGLRAGAVSARAEAARVRAMEVAEARVAEARAEAVAVEAEAVAARAAAAEQVVQAQVRQALSQRNNNATKAVADYHVILDELQVQRMTDPNSNEIQKQIAQAHLVKARLQELQKEDDSDDDTDDEVATATAAAEAIARDTEEAAKAKAREEAARMEAEKTAERVREAAYATIDNADPDNFEVTWPAMMDTLERKRIMHAVASMAEEAYTWEDIEIEFELELPDIEDIDAFKQEFESRKARRDVGQLVPDGSIWYIKSWRTLIGSREPGYMARRMGRRMKNRNAGVGTSASMASASGTSGASASGTSGASASASTSLEEPKESLDVRAAALFQEMERDRQMSRQMRLELQAERDRLAEEHYQRLWSRVPTDMDRSRSDRGWSRDQILAKSDDVRTADIRIKEAKARSGAIRLDRREFLAKDEARIAMMYRKGNASKAIEDYHKILDELEVKRRANPDISVEKEITHAQLVKAYLQARNPMG